MDEKYRHNFIYKILLITRLIQLFRYHEIPNDIDFDFHDSNSLSSLSTYQQFNIDILKFDHNKYRIQLNNKEYFIYYERNTNYLDVFCTCFTLRGKYHLCEHIQLLICYFDDEKPKLPDCLGKSINKHLYKNPIIIPTNSFDGVIKTYNRIRNDNHGENNLKNDYFYDYEFLRNHIREMMNEYKISYKDNFEGNSNLEVFRISKRELLINENNDIKDSISEKEYKEENNDDNSNYHNECSDAENNSILLDDYFYFPIKESEKMER